MRTRFVAALFLALLLPACGKGTPNGPTSLVVEDLVVGTGATAASGDTGLLVDTAPQTNQPKNRRVTIVINQ